MKLFLLSFVTLLFIRKKPHDLVVAIYFVAFCLSYLHGFSNRNIVAIATSTSKTHKWKMWKRERESSDFFFSWNGMKTCEMNDPAAFVGTMAMSVKIHRILFTNIFAPDIE